MDRRPVETLAGLHDGAGDMGRTGRECGRSGHTDGRVRRRIAGMGRAWKDGMGEDPPMIFPTGAGRRAVHPARSRWTRATGRARRTTATAGSKARRGAGARRRRVRRHLAGPVRRALDDGDPVPHAGSGTRIRAGGSGAAGDLENAPPSTP